MVYSDSSSVYALGKWPPRGASGDLWRKPISQSGSNSRFSRRGVLGDVTSTNPTIPRYRSPRASIVDYQAKPVEEIYQLVDEGLARDNARLPVISVMKKQAQRKIACDFKLREILDLFNSGVWSEKKLIAHKDWQAIQDRVLGTETSPASLTARISADCFLDIYGDALSTRTLMPAKIQRPTNMMMTDPHDLLVYATSSFDNRGISRVFLRPIDELVAMFNRASATGGGRWDADGVRKRLEKWGFDALNERNDLPSPDPRKSKGYLVMHMKHLPLGNSSSSKPVSTKRSVE